MKASLTPTQPRFITLAELARDWMVSRRTVKRLLERAGLKPFVLHDARNGTLRYVRSEVQTWLEQQRPK
jgi:hypothetical protein